MNSAPTTTKRRAPAAAKAKLQYPDPDKFPKSLFWLAIYFRTLAQSDALKSLTIEMHRRRRQADPMFHALYEAQDHMRKEIKQPLDYLIKEGMLLFAFEQTTVFDAPEVPA